jgi:hypothetical protein
MGLAGVALAAAFLGIVGSAPASTLCLQLKANGAVKGPTTVGGNTCKPGYEKIELPPAAQLETLNKILPHTKYEEKGVAGKPTIQFSGVNVQIVNGEGKTASTNGAGNLVIGYDENAGSFPQTGSHDLILGLGQTFTSYGGLVAGRENTLSGPFASVLGGQENVASGEGATVSGGFNNRSTALSSSVSGGETNMASGQFASVSGGFANTANELVSSITGGEHNLASGASASVSGGSENTAKGRDASVSGGMKNLASGTSASVSAGNENTASGTNGAWVGGGWHNLSSGSSAAVSGGGHNTAAADNSSIFGGNTLTTKSEYEAIP